VPNPVYLVGKRPDALRIAHNAIVSIVPTQQPTQVSMLNDQWIVTMASTVLIYTTQRASQSLLGRPASHDPHTSARTLPDMRKAEEVKRTTIMLVALTLMPEIHDASLRRMQCKTVLGHAFGHYLPYSLTVVAVVEYTDRVVCESHQLHLPRIRAITSVWNHSSNT